MIFRSKHKIWAIVVVILAELQLGWSNRRLDRFIMHAPFSQVEEPACTLSSMRAQTSNVTATITTPQRHESLFIVKIESRGTS